MRKGRSSRRSRVSRPLIGGAKAPISTSDVAVAESRVAPHVVVGVPPSDPPPEAPSVERPEKAAPETGAPASLEAKGQGAASTRGPLDPLQALETLERPPSAPPVKEQKPDLTKTIAFGGLAPEPKVSAKEAPKAEAEGARPTFDETIRDEPREDDKTKTLASFASTIAFGSEVKSTAAGNDEPAKAERDKTERFASTLALGSAVELERKGPAPAEKTEASEKTASSEKTQSFASTLALGSMPKPEAKAPSQESDGRAAKAAGKKKKKGGASQREAVVPPAPDSSGGVDEKFFSEGDVARHLAVPEALDSSDAITVQDKAKRKAEPEVVERRARFVRYVKWAVAGAAIVCVAAIARTTLTSTTPTPAARSTVRATAEPSPKAAEPTAAAETPAPPPSAEPAPSASAESASSASPAESASSAESAAPSAETAPVAAASASSSAAPDEGTTEPPQGNAKEEKAKARAALERRKIADAIAAGERSVAIDPTDGEAWLILGAAYQEKGNLAEARRAYSSCVKEGKTGPRHECMKMLR